jgi:hypothetical protein
MAANVRLLPTIDGSAKLSTTSRTTMSLLLESKEANAKAPPPMVNSNEATAAAKRLGCRRILCAT